MITTDANTGGLIASTTMADPGAAMPIPGSHPASPSTTPPDGRWEVALDGAVPQAKYAILAGARAASGALSRLASDGVIIDRLLATIPPNLGRNVDASA